MSIVTFDHTYADNTAVFSLLTFHKVSLQRVINYVSLRTAQGAWWLSGRVLDSRPKGRGFEPHRRHCVVVLEQDTFILA